MEGGSPRASSRAKLLDAAYDLFTRRGVRAVGVDAIVGEAGVAKATLYRNFGSKEELALAVLELREQRWTRDWLQAEVERRSAEPSERLLSIFDVFGEWFATEGFEGCSFINVMLAATETGDLVRAASVRHLENIRFWLREHVRAAGVGDVDDVAAQWHILMKGSIVAAGEGDLEAAARARRLGALLLESHGALASA